MREVTPDQIGSTLRRLAEDLVNARRLVARLERENGSLKEELEALRRSVSEHEAQDAVTNR